MTWLRTMLCSLVRHHGASLKLVYSCRGWHGGERRELRCARCGKVLTRWVLR